MVRARRRHRRGTAVPRRAAAAAGLWAATALFVAAHARAYRFRVDRTALAQIATLLAVGLLFGVVTRYVGLYAAIVAHVATDLAGLHVVRKAASRRILQTAA